MIQMFMFSTTKFHHYSQSSNI